MNSERYSIVVRDSSPEHGIAFWTRTGSAEDLPLEVPVRREGKKTEEAGTMDHPTMLEMRAIQRNYRHQPHLGFIPTTPIFEGPIWGRLKGDTATLKSYIKQKRSGKWALDWELSQSWARLEIALLPLIDLLRSSKLPHWVRAPLRPSDTFFWEDKDTQKRTLSSALFARKLFLEMAGELAYAVATSGYGQYGWVSYVRRVQADRGLCYPEEWLLELSRTKVLDFRKTKRAGYVIDLDQMRSPSEVITYEQHGAPCFVAFAEITYIRGGFPIVKKSPVNLPSHVESIAPAPVDFMVHQVDGTQLDLAIHIRESASAARELEELHGLGSFAYYPDPEAPTPDPEVYPAPPYSLPHFPPQDYPTPDPLSRQQPGQTWREFFFERQEGNCFAEKTETVLERTARLERKKRAEEYNRPGKRPKNLGASVYTWEESPHPDITIRSRLHKDDIEIYWDDFYPDQRLYDEFANEWDLCPHIKVDKTQLPSEVRRYYAELYDDGDDEPILPLYATRDELNMPNLTVQEASATAAVAQVQEHSESMLQLLADSQGYWERRLLLRQRSRLLCSMRPASYAAHRFGLRITHPFTPIVEIPKEVNWAAALGMKIEDAGNRDIEGDMHLREFIVVLNVLKQARSTNTPPNPPNLASLYTRMDIHPSVDTLLVSPCVRVRCVEATSSGENFPLYFFSFENEGYKNNDWTLAVRSAANAVLAIRERWGSTRENLVFNFLRYGIPFNTFQRKYVDTLDNVSFPDFYPMPFAKPDAAYTLDNYQQYHDLREAFFDSSFGGIAGRSGGIVARLWREDRAKFEPRVQRIMAGPTLYSLVGGYVVDCGPDGIYYDDKLTEGMYAVISGQYLRQDSKFPFLFHLFYERTFCHRVGPTPKPTKYINLLAFISDSLRPL